MASNSNGDNNDVVDMDVDIINQEPVLFSTLLDQILAALDELDEKMKLLEALSSRPSSEQLCIIDQILASHEQINEKMTVLETLSASSSIEQLSTMLDQIKEKLTLVKALKARPRKALNPTAKLNPKNRDNEEINNDGFFECSICLDMASEPIVTCCGHLFCWACFSQVKPLKNGVRKCPVCKGEVKDTSITPIYVKGRSASLAERESGRVVPPRPKAQRVESDRQQNTIARLVTEMVRDPRLYRISE